MPENEDIERVIIALGKVPPKRLLLIDLANRFAQENGELDYQGLAAIEPEVNMAIAEAKMYGSYTLMAVDTLKRVAKGEEDV